jgi:hypothetical protein
LIFVCSLDQSHFHPWYQKWNVGLTYKENALAIMKLWALWGLVLETTGAPHQRRQIPNNFSKKNSTIFLSKQRTRCWSAITPCRAHSDLVYRRFLSEKFLNHETGSKVYGDRETVRHCSHTLEVTKWLQKWELPFLVIRIKPRIRKVIW